MGLLTLLGILSKNCIEIDSHYAATLLFRHTLLNSRGVRWKSSLKLLANSAVLLYPKSPAIALTRTFVACNCSPAAARRMLFAYSLIPIPLEPLNKRRA